MCHPFRRSHERTFAHELTNGVLRADFKQWECGLSVKNNYNFSQQGKIGNFEFLIKKEKFSNSKFINCLNRKSNLCTLCRVSLHLAYGYVSACKGAPVKTCLYLGECCLWCALTEVVVASAARLKDKLFKAQSAQTIQE